MTRFGWIGWVIACTAVLGGCHPRNDGTGGGGGGDLGATGGGDLATDGGTSDGPAGDLGSPGDLAHPPDLMPLPDLGGWLDPNWIDPTGSRDLTAEGTSDWVHWGLTSENSVDRRAGIAPVITATKIGTNSLSQYGDNHVLYSWSNGSPTASTSSTSTGVFITGVGNGFKITVPAEGTPHTLRVYMSAFGSDYKLTTHVSDGSAPDYIDDQVNPAPLNNPLYRMYTFTYKSLQPGQTFVVSWIDTLDHFGGGNVTLQAATLQ